MGTSSASMGERVRKDPRPLFVKRKPEGETDGRRGRERGREGDQGMETPRRPTKPFPDRSGGDTGADGRGIRSLPRSPSGTETAEERKERGTKGGGWVSNRRKERNDPGFDRKRKGTDVPSVPSFFFRTRFGRGRMLSTGNQSTSSSETRGLPFARARSLSSCLPFESWRSWMREFGWIPRAERIGSVGCLRWWKRDGGERAERRTSRYKVTFLERCVVLLRIR